MRYGVFSEHIFCTLARVKNSLYVEEQLSTNSQFSRFAYLIKENICKNKHPSQIINAVDIVRIRLHSRINNTLSLISICSNRQ